MAEHQPADWKLFCIVIDAESPFPVDIRSNTTVGDLKEAIKTKKPHDFAGFDADRLTLYLVNLPDDDDLAKKVKQPITIGPLTALKATKQVGAFLPDGPTEETVHILVQTPDSLGQKHGLSNDHTDDAPDPKRKKRLSGPESVVIHREWCEREDTLSGIFDLLREYRLVQVRGTPASGKTTLMYLLDAYIMQRDPEAQVSIMTAWPESRLKDDEERIRKRLTGYPSFEDGKYYFLFDEGQSSYWDVLLWTAFKNRIQHATSQPATVYVILFCSYGNDDVVDAVTPLDFGSGKVTLDRANPALPNPCGLLLDKAEFVDVIRRRPNLRLADDLRDFVYGFTRGHVGATVAVLEFLLKKQGPSMLRGDIYSLEQFHQDTRGFDELCRHLYMDRGIARGMPGNPADYAQAMRALLLQGSIDRDNNTQPDIASCLLTAYKSGFVDLDRHKRYIFASPLHQQLWSWHLLPQTDYQLPHDDLVFFVEDAVSRFRPSQLDQSDRRVGSASGRPPEAQYQAEYYRCVHLLTQGNVKISPEYAAAAGSRPGRIDFFIPSKKWGIELTRDGSRLNEHASRFADDGAYGQWLLSSDMLEYVLLDFRSTMPRAHPGIRNLYHLVFSSDKTQVAVYDNQLTLRAQKNLMQQS